MSGRFLHTQRLLGILVFIMVLCGCNPKALMLKSMEPIMDDMNIAVNRNTDVDMLHDAMPALLVQMDGFLLSAPNDKRLLQAAEAYFGYANCYVEDTDKQQAGKLYFKARSYALRALFGEGDTEKFLNKDQADFKDMLQGYGKGDVPALFWTANSWIAWIALNLDKPEAVIDVPKAQAMLERVVELDESFYYGSAHTALGALFAAQPRMMGDTSAKAKQHFDKAFELSGRKLLLVHLYYAKFYAYQIQDRDLFVKTLEEVLAAPSDIFPDRAFANEVAKRKAKILLDNVDMYF